MTLANNVLKAHITVRWMFGWMLLHMLWLKVQHDTQLFFFFFTLHFYPVLLYFCVNAVNVSRCRCVPPGQLPFISI